MIILQGGNGGDTDGVLPALAEEVEVGGKVGVQREAAGVLGIVADRYRAEAAGGGDAVGQGAAARSGDAGVEGKVEPDPGELGVGRQVEGGEGVANAIQLGKGGILGEVEGGELVIRTGQAF